MKRHVAVMVQPIAVAEVGDIHNQRIALPATDRVAAIRRHDVVAMRSSIGVSPMAAEGEKEQMAYLLGGRRIEP